MTTVSTTLDIFSSASDALLSILSDIFIPYFQELRLDVASERDPVTVPDFSPLAAFVNSESLPTLRRLTFL